MQEAVDRLGSGPLQEDAIARWLRPLFSRTLAHESGIYLVSHALGRPLDRVQDDLTEFADHWSARLRGAWEPWLAEQARFRARVAALLALPSPGLVVPKPHAEAALRAVLNTLPQGAAVLTTKDEFAAVSVVLSQYAALGRLRVHRVATEGPWNAAALIPALRCNPVLVVVSQCFYKDGQLFRDISALAEACHRQDARLLVDAYHSVGAVPVDMPALGCDYLLGGCYKYLRGAPGIAFLALAPSAAASVRPLDIGWLAQDTDAVARSHSHSRKPTGHAPIDASERPDGPTLLPEGDGWLEGSPAFLLYYQARSGLEFTLAVGMDRLRAYSLGQLQFLRGLLAAHGIESEGGDAEHGAFLTVPTPRAPELVQSLTEQGIVVDERAGRVRICPDILTTRAELERVADAVSSRLKIREGL